jgi:hypothetical protein
MLQSIVLPPNDSFCPFSSTLSLIFTSASYLAPTCQHTTPPSYTITFCWLAYCTNCIQPHPLAIPDTRTLHYNTNIPKHTSGPQNPAVPIHLPPATHLFPTPLFSAMFTNAIKSVSSLITITCPNSHYLYTLSSKGFLYNT